MCSVLTNLHESESVIPHSQRESNMATSQFAMNHKSAVLLLNRFYMFRPSWPFSST